MKKTGLIIAVLLFFLLNSGFSQDYDLKYNLPQGTKFTITSESEAEEIINQMGNEVANVVKSSTESICEVLSDRDDGSMLIEFKFGERSRTIETVMGEHNVDYSELIGKKVKFVLSPNGKASEFEGFDELPEIDLGFGQTLTKDRYMDRMKNLFPELPEKGVKLGDTWSRKVENEQPRTGGSVKTTVDYTYTAAEELEREGEDCLKIDVKMKITTTGAFEQNDNQLEIDLNGEGTITQYFAFKKGMVIFRESTTTTEGDINLPAMGMTLPMNSSSKGTMKITIE